MAAEYGCLYFKFLAPPPHPLSEVSCSITGILDYFKTNIFYIGVNFFCRENFLNLDIYYKELAVEEIIQQPAFEFLSLLSEVGGFLGLLLGASVLTVCEVVDFIIVTTGSYCSARKIKTKVKTFENDRTNTNMELSEQKNKDDAIREVEGQP